MKTIEEKIESLESLILELMSIVKGDNNMNLSLKQDDIHPTDPLS